MAKHNLITVLALILSIAGYSQNNSYIEFVNPFVGTDLHGHTFPGATYPFGMVQLSPDTRLSGWDGCSGYHYSDSTIYGFSHTHLSGTGCADYCDILVMPVKGYFNSDIDNELYKSAFSHSKEKTSPGYYEVFLDKWEVLAQLTAGKRVGLHKYTFQKNVAPQLIIDLTHRDQVLDSRLEIVDDHTIQGFRRSRDWATDQIVYFYMEFSSPIKETNVQGNKALLSFAEKKNNVVLVKVGISSVSENNAKENLYSELKGYEFDKLKASTEKAWNDYLGKIEVTSTNSENKKTFYTALYHTAISPNLYSDANGEYRGMDREVHKAEGYEQYSVFSLWDTYRALHPLFTIIEQKRTTDFIRSFLSMYREAGKLPIWELSGNETNCMIGYHSVSVIADAVCKNIGGFDINEAMDAMVSSSNKKEYGIDFNIENGYVPAELEHESVSKTLEYAYDDWCIAQVAKRQGIKDLSDIYIKRAQHYKNIFDPQTGFMRPKINGQWLTPFNPSEVNVHFTEANSWQYSFYVPQDIESHIKMLGGDEKYSAKLDELFSASDKTTGRTQVDITGLIGQYAHGNEPSHHTAYLYAYAGKPWKTQQLVRKIMKTFYTCAPDGLCGNDDCGQMSAWYVMSAMGFYPVTPGDDTYVLGSPLFSKAVINLEDQRKFTIEAPGASDDGIYIKSATLNGNPYTKSFIKHSDITSGSTLCFEMSQTPNSDFATNPQDRPRSFINDSSFVINPWFETPGNIFRISTEVSIKSVSPDYSIWYAVDNDEFDRYDSPFMIDKSSIIKACCIDKRGRESFLVNTSLDKINSNLKISLLSKFNPQYNAGGAQGLIDGIRGSLNFRLGGWQGYQGTDFEAIVEIKTEKLIHRIGAGFLQDAKSWIWMPEYVEFSISSDGIKFTPIGRVCHSVDPKDYTLQIHDLCLDNLKVMTKYVKITARNFGTIPDWHAGAGGEGFIFIDEIFVE